MTDLRVNNEYNFQKEWLEFFYSNEFWILPNAVSWQMKHLHAKKISLTESDHAKKTNLLLIPKVTFEKITECLFASSKANA